MRSTLFYSLIVASAVLFMGFGKGASETETMTVAFYNVENLFDTTDDPAISDEEFLPDSRRQWNTNKYETKIEHLAKVLSNIGSNGPDVLGLAEIENIDVVEALSDKMKTSGYRIIHKNSPDERGIDVALLYKPANFKTSVHEFLTVEIPNDRPTRDILHVQFTTQDDQTLHVYVNHWPSRWGGKDTSEPKRVIAATVLRKSIDRALSADPDAQILIMGDFNDEPGDKSISQVLGANGNPTNTPLYNPFYALWDLEAGSYCYHGHWNMLDQIMISQGLRDGKSWDYVPNSQYIFDRPWLRQTDNNYAGWPLRTFGGPNYLAGYSDHLPVFIQLNYKK